MSFFGSVYADPDLPQNQRHTVVYDLHGIIGRGCEDTVVFFE